MKPTTKLLLIAGSALGGFGLYYLLRPTNILQAAPPPPPPAKPVLPGAQPTVPGQPGSYPLPAPQQVQPSGTGPIAQAQQAAQQALQAVQPYAQQAQAYAQQLLSQLGPATVQPQTVPGLPVPIPVPFPGTIAPPLPQALPDQSATPAALLPFAVELGQDAVGTIPVGTRVTFLPPAGFIPTGLAMLTVDNPSVLTPDPLAPGTFVTSAKGNARVTGTFPGLTGSTAPASSGVIVA